MSNVDLIARLRACAECEQQPLAHLLEEAADALDAGELKPIGYISETVRQELLNGKHVPANICTATPGRRNPHPGPDMHWSVPIFVARLNSPKEK